LAVDGKYVYQIRDLGDSGKTVMHSWNPGFHLISVSFVAQNKNRFLLKMARCKTSDISSCEGHKNIQPVMSWPPVCGDAVKYAYTGIQPDIGDLGETDSWGL